MKNIFLFLTFLVFSDVLFSQEFKIQVSVSSTVQGTDRKIYESMQTSLNDFINNRKWTNFNYKTEEKIEGSISIADIFVIGIAIQSSASPYSV